MMGDWKRNLEESDMIRWLFPEHAFCLAGEDGIGSCIEFESGRDIPSNCMDLATG
jgi:hypothetical protein